MKDEEKKHEVKGKDPYDICGWLMVFGIVVLYILIVLLILFLISLFVPDLVTYG